MHCCNIRVQRAAAVPYGILPINKYYQYYQIIFCYKVSMQVCGMEARNEVEVRYGSSNPLATAAAFLAHSAVSFWELGAVVNLLTLAVTHPPKLCIRIYCNKFSNSIGGWVTSALGVPSESPKQGAGSREQEPEAIPPILFLFRVFVENRKYVNNFRGLRVKSSTPVIMQQHRAQPAPFFAPLAHLAVSTRERGAVVLILPHAVTHPPKLCIRIYYNKFSNSIGGWVTSALKIPKEFFERGSLVY